MLKPVSDLTPKARRTRLSLVQAAQRLLGRAGISAVTVMGVCAEAGVGRTSFYGYFEHLDDLILAVSDAAVHQLRDQFNAVHSTQPRGFARLEHCLEMILTTAGQDRDTVLLITSLAENGSQVFELLLDEIQQELDAEAQAAHVDHSQQCLEEKTVFLTIATLAAARQIALGAVPVWHIPAQIKMLMQACQFETQNPASAGL